MEKLGECLSFVNVQSSNLNRPEKCSPAKVEIGDFVEVKIGILVFQSAQKAKSKMSVVLRQITILSNHQRKVSEQHVMKSRRLTILQIAEDKARKARLAPVEIFLKRKSDVFPSDSEEECRPKKRTAAMDIDVAQKGMNSIDISK